MYFDDLAVAGRSEAYAMVLNAQIQANFIHLVPNLPTGFRIRIVQKPYRRMPNQVPS